MKFRISVIFFCCFYIISFYSFGQKEAYKWYFGKNAGLNFGTSTISATDNSLMNTNAGCASISNTSGDLLFYTDGNTVWNKNHAVMVNGTNLQGLADAAQSSIIVPQPLKNDSLYYIFTVDPTIRAMVTGLKYSIVNTNRRSGLGEIISKNNHVFEGTTEHLTATRHGNQKDIWIMVMEQNFQHLRAYKLTDSGLVSQPVLSTIPINISNFLADKACMKFSQSGNKLAVNIGLQGTLLFDFDNTTGKATNAILIPPALVANATYGVEFSPIGTYLYLSNGAAIHQYDISGKNITNIIASKYEVVNAAAYSMQLGPDSKIYVAINNTARLGIIQNPDDNKINCNYTTTQLLQNTLSYKGLPQYLPNYYFIPPPAFNFTTVCSGDSTEFILNRNLTDIDSLNWSFGDTSSGIYNFSSQINPKHSFTQHGTYTVKLTMYAGSKIDTFTQDVVVLYPPKAKIFVLDTVFCELSTVTLRNVYPPNTAQTTYLWSDQSSDLTMSVLKTGWYWLEVSNGICTIRDSIYIRFQKRPKVNLGDNLAFCGLNNDPILLHATNPGATYLWQDGSTDSVYLAKNPGTYVVEVTLGPCNIVASKEIKVSTPVKFNLGKDLFLCNGDSQTLKTPFLETIWSTGDTGTAIHVTEPGMFWAKVKNGACIFIDTIQISYKKCITKNSIPNIITPNGDRVNQTFLIKDMEPFTWAIEIFNRWGQKVYANPKYNNEWNADGLKDGVYYYTLTNPEDGQTFKGWVEVMR